jgi:hypothetical protein
VARYHNVCGPNGTYDGGREQAPAAICRKVIAAKLSGEHEIQLDAPKGVCGPEQRQHADQKLINWAPLSLEDAWRRPTGGSMTR